MSKFFRSYIPLIGLLLLILLIAVISKASATDVNLTWTFDSSLTATCADGVSLASINCPATGFEAQLLTSTPPAVDVWSVSATIPSALRTFRLTNIAPGNRCFRLRTQSNTVFSDPGSKVCADIKFLPPKAPQGMVITVIVTVEPNP